MENRITTARFLPGEKITYTEPLWQFDYGQEIRIEGLELPESRAGPRCELKRTEPSCPGFLPRLCFWKQADTSDHRTLD